MFGYLYMHFCLLLREMENAAYCLRHVYGLHAEVNSEHNYAFPVT